MLHNILLILFLFFAMPAMASIESLADYRASQVSSARQQIRLGRLDQARTLLNNVAMNGGSPNLLLAMKELVNAYRVRCKR